MSLSKLEQLSSTSSQVLQLTNRLTTLSENIRDTQCEINVQRQLEDDRLPSCLSWLESKKKNVDEEATESANVDVSSLDVDQLGLLEREQWDARLRFASLQRAIESKMDAEAFQIKLGLNEYQEDMGDPEERAYIEDLLSVQSMLSENIIASEESRLTMEVELMRTKSVLVAKEAELNDFATKEAEHIFVNKSDGDNKAFANSRKAQKLAKEEAKLNQIRYQRGYVVDIDSDPEGDLHIGSSDPGWITAAVFMRTSKHVVFCTSLRTVHFYDASASMHIEQTRLIAVPHIPTCMTLNEDTISNEISLFIGDDSGSISCFRFKRANESMLFGKPEAETSVHLVFYPDLLNQQKRSNKLVSLHYAAHVHNDAVNAMSYLIHNDTLLSSSRDPKASMVIRSVAFDDQVMKGEEDGRHENKQMSSNMDEGEKLSKKNRDDIRRRTPRMTRLQPYVFSMPSGVSCHQIAFGPRAQMVAAGSGDKLVRLFSPFVTSQAVQTLSGHEAIVVDLCFLWVEDNLILISMDRLAVVRVWDVYKGNGSCLSWLSTSFSLSPSSVMESRSVHIRCRPSLYLLKESHEDIDALLLLVYSNEVVRLSLGLNKLDKLESANTREEHVDPDEEQRSEERIACYNSEREEGEKRVKEDSDRLEYLTTLIAQQLKCDSVILQSHFRDSVEDDGQEGREDVEEERKKIKRLAKSNMPYMALRLHDLIPLQHSGEEEEP